MGTEKRGQSTALAVLLTLFACSTAHAIDPGTISPPFTPPTETVQEILNSPSVTWDSTQVGQVRLYTQPGSVSYPVRDSLAQVADDAVKHAVQLLELDRFPHGLRVFLLRDRDQMQEFIRHRYKGFSLFGDDAALLVHNKDVRPYFRHELFHNVSLRMWSTTEVWLREGAAVAADGSCLEFTTLDVAAYLVESGKALPFRELLDHFGDHNDLITYLQAARPMARPTMWIRENSRCWRSIRNDCRRMAKNMGCPGISPAARKLRYDEDVPSTTGEENSLVLQGEVFHRCRMI